VRQKNQALSGNDNDKNWLTLEGFGRAITKLGTSPLITQYTQHIPRGFAINSTLFGCMRARFFITRKLISQKPS